MTALSTLREYTEYVPVCGGCGLEYGESYDNEPDALTAIRDSPRCQSCTAGVTLELN